MESANDLHCLRAEIQQKAGRNLLRYQLVELLLKKTLPFRTLDVSLEGIEALKAARESAQGATLGNLIGDYARGVSISSNAERVEFQEALTRFTSARNRLVHHLLADFALLATVDDCKRCIERLDEEHKAAEGLTRQIRDYHRFVTGAAKMLIDELALHESEPFDSRAFLTGLGSKISTNPQMCGSEVKVELPFLEFLDQTLGSVERIHRRDDGWTDFNHLAHAIHREFGGLPKDILSIARQLTRHDFAQRPAQEGGGCTWMYRSKVS